MTNPKGWNSTPAHLRSVDPQDLSAVIQALGAAADMIERLERENERLRTLLTAACERNGGVCAYGNGNEADRDPCTPENCSTARIASEPNSPQAPVAKIRVWAHLPPDVTLYSPGLPPGEHDVYCEPASVAPYMSSAPSAAVQVRAEAREASGPATGGADPLNFESIREDYQALTGVCPLPGPPSKKSATEPGVPRLCDGEVRVIYEHGEPKGVRDATGFLCFFNRVSKYEGQEDRYRSELALRARQAEAIATAFRSAVEKPGVSGG